MNLDKFFALEIVEEYKIENRRKADHFEHHPIGKKSGQVKKYNQEESSQQLHIINGTFHHELIVTGFAICQLNWLSKMKTVCHHHFGMIMYRDHDGFVIQQWIY